MLSPALERVLLKAACGLLDGSELPPPDPRFLARLNGLTSALPRSRARLLHLAGRSLEVLSLMRHRRPFHRLDDERAGRLLRSLARSRLPPLRRLHHVLKQLLQYALFLDDERWPQIGYGGPWLGRVDVEVHAAPNVGEPGS